MDRTAKVFLTARWAYLGMLNYAVDPALLQHRVPPGTELDFFEGRTYVSVVGFRFLETRVLGVPIPFYRDFDEINLRFYVRHRTPDGWRRGVAFVRELVPKRAVAAIARAAFDEPYAAVPMSHDIRDDGTGPARSVSLEYRWRHRASAGTMSLNASGEPALPADSSLEQFIVEHYWGYGSDRSGHGVEYAVRHQPWRVWIAEGSFSGETASIYGSELHRLVHNAPDSSCVAEGSPISVSWAQRLPRP